MAAQSPKTPPSKLPPFKKSVEKRPSLEILGDCGDLGWFADVCRFRIEKRTSPSKSDLIWTLICPLLK